MKQNNTTSGFHKKETNQVNQNINFIKSTSRIIHSPQLNRYSSISYKTFELLYSLHKNMYVASIRIKNNDNAKHRILTAFFKSNIDKLPIRVKCEVQTIRGSNVLVGILYRQQQRTAWPRYKSIITCLLATTCI